MATCTADAPRPCAKYDLTQTMASFMDVHMMFPILKWLRVKKMYNDADLQQAEFDTANETSMTDYAKEIYTKLYPNKPPLTELDDKKKDVVAQYMAGTSATKPLMDLLENEELVHKMSTFNAAGLEEAGLENAAEAVEALYAFAKIQMDVGQYAEASKKLHFFTKLVDEESEAHFQALWGQLAADILEMRTDDALSGLQALRAAIDKRTFNSPLEKLQQRSWLVHWALFIFFSRPDGARLICDFFFQSNEEVSKRGRDKFPERNVYIGVIQTNCSWMLRYLSAAMIIQKSRKLPELVDALRQEKGNYSDPITEMLECLYINYDLHGAQRKLRECESVLRSDFFFSLRGNDFATEFIEAARKLIFKTFCLIHQDIDMKVLAEKLHMEVEDTEKWMVDMIRNTNMDNAKIDSANHMAFREVNIPTVYEKIIQKTEDLTTRVYDLANNIQQARGI